MRKRLKKKLSLNRETLRNLAGDHLRKAAGAGGCTYEDLTTCVCTDACDSGASVGCGTAGCGSGPNCPTLTVYEISCCDC